MASSEGSRKQTDVGPPPATERRRAPASTDRRAEAEKTCHVDPLEAGLQNVGSSQAGDPLAGIPERFKSDSEHRSGGEGDVYFCSDSQHPGSRVAIKIYQHGKGPDRAALEKRLQLRHKGVQTLLDHGFTTEGRFYEIQEYAEGGSLQEALDTGYVFDEETLQKRILRQLVEALSHLHGQGLIHRDVKPSNLLFRDKAQTQLLLSDFGLAAMAGSGPYRFSAVGGATWQYAAPEVLSPTGASLVSGKADYFSLGLTVDTLLRGEWYGGTLLRSEEFDYLRQNHRLEPPAHVSPRMRSLLRGLLHPIPDRRWGEQQVRDWMAGKAVLLAHPDASETPFHYKVREDLIADSVPALARLLLDNPAEARRHVRSETLEKALVVHDQDLAVRLHEVRSAAPSEELCALESTYTLDPTLPFVLLPGREASTPAELAALIDKDRKSWDAGRQALFSLRIPVWMRACGHHALLRLWNEQAGQYTATETLDAGLERFLHILNPRLAPPSLSVSRAIVDFGAVEGDRQLSQTVKVTNRSRGFASVGVEVAGGGAVFSASPPYVRLFPGEVQEVTVTADSRGLDRGRTYSSVLTMTGNTPEPTTVALALRAAWPQRALLLNALGFGGLGLVLAGLYRWAVAVLGGRNPAQWLTAGPPPQGMALEFAILPVAIAMWLAVRARSR